VITLICLALVVPAKTSAVAVSFDALGMLQQLGVIPAQQGAAS